MNATEKHESVRKEKPFWSFGKAFDKTIDLFAVLALILLSFTVIIVTAEIAMRFFFNRPLMWSIEVTEYCLIWITFLGTAWVLRKEGHVIVDIVVMRIPATSRHMLNVILSILGIIMCLLLTWYGVKVVLEFLQLGRPMSTVIMPPAWILYLIIPIGSLLLTIQFIRRTVKNFNLWKDSHRKIAERAV